MKTEAIYGGLKQLAETLDILVLEQNLNRFKDIKTRSGLCRVNGKWRIILDKKLHVSQKTAVLASCLSHFDHHSVYVLPALREWLNRWKPSKGA